jgi:hypothetical protein
MLLFNTFCQIKTRFTVSENHNFFMGQNMLGAYSRHKKTDRVINAAGYLFVIELDVACKIGSCVLRLYPLRLLIPITLLRRFRDQFNNENHRFSISLT